jgi:hypothetical protein
MSGFSGRTASISSRESEPSPPELIEVVTSSISSAVDDPVAIGRVAVPGVRVDAAAGAWRQLHLREEHLLAQHVPPGPDCAKPSSSQRSCCAPVRVAAGSWRSTQSDRNSSPHG